MIHDSRHVRRYLFPVSCAIIGGMALIAMWPPRAPTSDPPFQPPSLIPRPSSLVPPTVSPTDPIRGNPSAPLTIIEFADFTCPACAEVEEVLTALRAEYGDRLRIVWKDLPHLDRITGSRSLHLAARCAQSQGKFWELHDALFARGPYGMDTVDALVVATGLDPRAFAACTEQSMGSDRINANIADATRAGVTATPAFFINDVLLTDAPSLSVFRTRLEQPK